MAPAPLGVWPLELEGHEELEECGDRNADICGPISAIMRTSTGAALADGSGVGCPDLVARSAEHFQGGRPNLPEASGKGT